MDVYERALKKIKCEQEKYKLNQFYCPSQQILIGPPGPHTQKVILEKHILLAMIYMYGQKKMIIGWT